MTAKLPDASLDQLFRDARSRGAWQDKDVPDSLLHELVDLVKLGPTSGNCSPARFVFVKSKNAKERLEPYLSAGNREKTMKAPVCAIIGYDLDFYEHLPTLFPHTDAKAWFEGKPQKIADSAFRNGTLQAAYLILAARGAWARLRADVGLRPRGRRFGVLCRDQCEIQFSVQSRLWQRCAFAPARAALRLRPDGADRLRSSHEHLSARYEHGRLLRRGVARWRCAEA